MFTGLLCNAEEEQSDFLPAPMAPHYDAYLRLDRREIPAR